MRLAVRPELAPLAVRAALGATFLAAGWDHALLNPDSIAGLLGGLPAAGLVGSLLSWGELLAGIGLLLGALLPLCAFATLTVNLGALALFGLGVWTDLVMVAGALYLLAHGPGPWSVDGALAHRVPSIAAWLAPLRRGRAPEWSWLALRLALGAGLLLGASRAFGARPGGLGWLVVGAAPDLAPLVGLTGAAAGALFLLGALPRVAAGLVGALGLLLTLKDGVTVQGLAWQFWPSVGAALAFALAGPGPWTFHSLAQRAPRLASEPARTAAAVGVGALLLALAVFAGASPRAPALEPTSTWTLRELALGDGQGSLREGQAWVGSVPVRSLVLHEVVATLTWQDDMPGSAPDEFTLELVPPPGLMAGPAAEGLGGELRVVVPVYREPPERGPEVGAGTWTVRVYLRSAGDASTLGVLPGEFDGGNDFRVRVTARVFER